MKTRSLVRSALAVALLLTAVPSVRAADGPDLDRHITLKLEDADPGQAFAALARLSNLEIALDPGVHGKVNIQLENVRLRTVLDAMCDSLGCRWDAADNHHLRVIPTAEKTSGEGRSTLDEPIDVKVTAADARSMLKTFGSLMSAEVTIDPAVKGEVSLNLQSVPVRKVLDAICQAVSCSWSYDADKKVLAVRAKS
jgi:type II secretory pathway component GspD/PulD (secretin)